MKNEFFKNKQGEPVLLTGLQCHNSSTGSPKLDEAIAAVKKFGGNVLEAPVYWYWLEPSKGVYDLTHVKDLIHKTRDAGLYLVILWFGANKNGHPNYVPEYVKLAPETYRLAVAPGGAAEPSMSPHCRETMLADQKVFVELMKCIREEDETHGTVLAVQVENEAGLGGTDRDYSALAQEDYQKPVPKELQGVTIEDSGASLKDNTWIGRFGRYANEAFTSWYQARFIDEIAAAGKAVYDLPMYVNAMIGEPMGIGGVSYNSGGPVVRMLDIWKKAAPHIDLLSPDIYCPAKTDYLHFCEAYAREDNPLFIPESGFRGISASLNVIRAVAQYGAIGVCCFGAESALDEKGELREEAKDAAVSFQMVQNIAPLLIKYRGTGRIHGFIQEEFMTKQLIVLPDYRITAHFGPYRRSREEQGDTRGRGILVQTGDFEFYLTGDRVAVDFLIRPQPEEENPHSWIMTRQSKQLNFLSVEEGHFENGQWVVDFRRNGDESNYELYARKGEVVRIRLNPMMGAKGGVTQ